MQEGRSRFLLWFSYMGTRFSGVQKQAQNITVQGVLDNALSVILQTAPREIRTAVSSRTDAGVHALQNTASLDVPSDRSGILGVRPPYEPKILVRGLNALLTELELEVRVLDLHPIAANFDIRRHCKGRSYRYRLGALRPEFAGVAGATALLPVFEAARAMPVEAGFDPLRAQRFCRLLQGTHNYASFMGAPTDTRPSAAKAVNTTRVVDSLSLETGAGLLSPALDPAFARFDFYDLKVESRGFLYQQVRRMTAAIVAGGRGLISEEDVEWMLANPDPASWDRIAQPLAPPGGLYLAQIRYDQADYLNPRPMGSRLSPEIASE